MSLLEKCAKAIYDHDGNLMVHFGNGVPSYHECAHIYERLARAVLNKIPEPLFEAIAHGDEEHRAWLKAKLDEFFLHSQAEGVKS